MRRTPRKGRPEERSPSRSGYGPPPAANSPGTAPVESGGGLSGPGGGRQGGGSGSRVVRRGRPDRSVQAAERQLRPLGRPRRVRVEVDPAGAPLRVSPGRGAWRGVLSVQERWRIDDEWWRDVLSREYFKVVLEDGRMVELYLDRVKRAWYAHGGGSAFADR